MYLSFDKFVKCGGNMRMNCLLVDWLTITSAIVDRNEVNNLQPFILYSLHITAYFHCRWTFTHCTYRRALLTRYTYRPSDCIIPRPRFLLCSAVYIRVFYFILCSRVKSIVVSHIYIMHNKNVVSFA